MSHYGWPAVLRDGDVELRPYRMRDAAAWSEVRIANEAWLTPWEPSGAGSWVDRHAVTAFAPMLRQLRRYAREGTTLPFAVTYRGRLVGQVTAGNVWRGSLNSCFLGYWVDGRYAGRGITPTAVALLTDHCFGAARLHRVEVNIRPENTASRRVAEKLGFREEGVRERYLFIDGAYRDHLCYALTVEEVPGGLLRRWHSARRA
ncbi:MAG TPA: GNAT family protein [Mycobacteriales bacterium]|jgi:ribosomal-protein-alanine N-acetyltransferase|nr:GNAT family protein [Mycobacteriales bacterium]